MIPTELFCSAICAAYLQARSMAVAFNSDMNCDNSLKQHLQRKN